VNRFFASLLGLWLGSAAMVSAGTPMSFWVWNHPGALPPSERESLRKADVARLYWHVADLHWEKGAWKPGGEISAPLRVEGLEVVPVFRLHAEAASASGDFETLGRQLASYLGQFGISQVQIDYDCSDASLARYAEGLQRCREKLRPAQLTATALAGWIDRKAFPALERAVDGLFPMFYDLEPDTPAAVREGRFAPIANLSQNLEFLKRWRRCSVPWTAGLPCFSRLSLFAPGGELLGHVRTWDWDSVIFNPAFRLQTASADFTHLRVLADVRFGQTAIHRGEQLVARETAPRDLALLAKAAAEAGAAGVIWFRLPDGSPQTSVSIGMLRTLVDGAVPAPRLHLSWDSKGRLLLANDGPADLLPRIAGRFGVEDRGWQLEVEADRAGAFQGASAGEFVQVLGFRDVDGERPVRVSLDQAQRLTFWFGSLPGGESLRTGVIPLDKPGHSESKWRWRVDGESWRSFD